MTHKSPLSARNDDAGYEWYRVNKDIRRDAIAQMLGDPDVRVGVHAGRARLRWNTRR